VAAAALAWRNTRWDAEEVMTLNDAQTWTIIGVLVAGFAAFLTVIMTMLNRTLSAELRAIRFEIAGVATRVDGITTRVDGHTTKLDRLTTRLDGLTTRVDQLTARGDGMGAEIASLRAEMGRRLDLLDAEVANLARKVFGQQ